MASIYILGAGAMGSLWATHLHLSLNPKPANLPTSNESTGHSVQFLSTRPNTPQKIHFDINSPFIQPRKNANEAVFNIELPLIHYQELNTATADNPNIILVCTKSYHAFDAVKLLQPQLNEYCYLVLFQNGLGSHHKIIEAVPDAPLFAAVSTEGVNRQANGTLMHAGKGLTRIGPLNASAKEKPTFEACLKALTHPGMDTEGNDNIWQALWEKLAINCAINPFTAIVNCPNGKIKDSVFFQENWPLLKVELTEMLNSAGIKITSFELEKRVFQVIESTQTNISSMLQDVRAGRKTEIDDINGFAARYLETIGQKNSINRMLNAKLNNS